MLELNKKYVDLLYIRKLREENHYSVTNLAKIMGFKSTEKYTRRENGKYNFRADELQMLSELYDIPMEKFFTNKRAKI